MELGICKRRRRRLSMGFRHRRVLVRVCTLALVALMLSCEVSNAQQQGREPALDVNALEEDVATAAAVPVEDDTKSTDIGRVEGWKDRKTPSASGPQGEKDAVSTSSDAAASAVATRDEPREQPILEETGVRVVDVPYEATAAAAAAASTSASSDTDGIDDGVGGDDDGGANGKGDSDDAEDTDAGASRPDDHRLGKLHPNSERDLATPAEEDGSQVPAAAHDQGTTVMVDAEVRVVAIGDKKGGEEKEAQSEGGGEGGGVGGEGDEQQQQQEMETEKEERLNAPETMNGTKSSLTDQDPEEEACCGDTSAAAAAEDDHVEANNEDDGPGDGGTNTAAPDIEPRDSAADGTPTPGSSGGGDDPVGRGGGGGADDTAAATTTAAAAAAAATTEQRLPTSEPENSANVDEAAAAFHAAESTATAGLPVEEAEAGSGGDAVTGSFDNAEGRSGLAAAAAAATAAAAAPSVDSSAGYGPADSRGERRQPAKTPGKPLLDTDTLADDVRVFSGQEGPPGMDEGAGVESAGWEGSATDGSNGRAGGGRYQRRDTDGQGLGARRGANKNDGENASSDGSAAGDGGAAGGDAGAEFARAPQEEFAQRVKQMEAEVRRKILAEEDAKSLLDIWVEQARDYVLNRTVPPTDAECDFNWSRLRCEPKCLCGARLRFGDYTPGRACRLLRPWELSPECEAAWDPSDDPAVRRFAATLAWGLGSAKRAYEARVAPPSDPECVFNLETRRCQPQSLCRLKFRWGDLTPSGACRLAREEKPATSAANGGVPLQ